MKNYLTIVFLLLITCLLFFSCVSGQEKTEATEKTVTAETKEETTSAYDEPATFKEIQTYLENGINKLDQMSVAEAINQFVAILAINADLTNPSDRIEEVAQQAQTELTKINAGFEISSGFEWQDEDGNQISGSSLNVGTEGGLNPTILLTFNFGGSKISVSGIPVIFEFIKGNGLLTQFVTTDDFGQATCSVAKIENPNQETIIRASITFTAKGYTYHFQGVQKDFVYIPPARKATILVLERAEDYTAEDPFIFNPVYDSLSEVNFDFSQYNGILLGDEFIKVFGGDLASIKKLALEQGVSYLVMVLNDCYSIRQLGDYKIYISEVKATLRIIRVADGKIMYEVVSYADKAHDSHGQGGNNEKAMRDGFRNSTERLVTKLSDQIDDIDEALLGTEE